MACRPTKPLPLLPPLPGPVRASGDWPAPQASTSTAVGPVPGSIRFDQKVAPKLLLKHDPRASSARSMLSLYTPSGDLIVDATVHDAGAATMPALSVGGAVRKYSVQEPEFPQSLPLRYRGLPDRGDFLDRTARKHRLRRQAPILADPRLEAYKATLDRGYAVLTLKQVDAVGRMAAEMRKLLESAPKAPPAAPSRKRFQRSWAVGDRINLDAHFSADADVEDGTIKGSPPRQGRTPTAMSSRRKPSTPRSERRASAGRVGSNCWRSTTGRSPPGSSSGSRPTPKVDCRSKRSST